VVIIGFQQVRKAVGALVRFTEILLPLEFVHWRVVRQVVRCRRIGVSGFVHGRLDGLPELPEPVGHALLVLLELSALLVRDICQSGSDTRTW